MKHALLIGACALGVAAATGSAAQTGSAPPSAEFGPVPAAPGSATPAPTAPAPAAPAPTAPAPAPAPPPPTPPGATQPATATPAAPPPAAPAPPAAAPAPYAPPPPPYYPPAPPPPAPAEPEPDRDVSLTLAPLLLMFPMAELGAELRLLDGFGATVRGGFGRWGVSLPDDKKATYPAWKVSGQLQWYLMHSFHGLHLGAELGYLRVTTDDPEFPWDSLRMRRLAVGPLLGYKLIARVGFTFYAQFGIVRAFEKARAESDVLGDATDDDERWDPLLNLGIGWSF